MKKKLGQIDSYRKKLNGRSDMKLWCGELQMYMQYTPRKLYDEPIFLVQHNSCTTSIFAASFLFLSFVVFFGDIMKCILTKWLLIPIKVYTLEE